ncbi:MAG: ankyrin repeat domain-containing protein [Elusimicrobiota bacterium]|jgi:ankyrin repeat protein|nr:ankyrin repeat domain-containing protein [Elusimicrobiota bacterium]
MSKKIFFVILAALLALPAAAQQKGVYSEILGGDAEKKNETPQYTYLYDTSLIRAIKAKDEDRIKILLYANVDTNEKNDEGFTPLVLAAEGISLEYIRLMLQRGAKVNLPSKYNITPLMAAAAANRPDVVRLLLEYGADPALTDDMGRNAVLHAVKSKAAACVGILSAVTKKTDFDRRDKDDLTPALYAARNGDVQTITFLGKAGADLNAKDDAGKTPLIIAVDAANRPLVRELLALKADAAQKDNAGRTALMHAVQIGDIPISGDLIAAGADVNTPDVSGTAPLMLAARGRNARMAALLVKSGADANAQDVVGRTPLTRAMENNDYATFAAVLAAPAIKPDFLYGADGATPLINAVKKKDDKFTAALIKRGANVNIKDKAGKNALIYALENGNYNSFAALVQSPNAQPDLPYGTDSTTLLISAARMGDLKSATILVKRGADTNKEDIFGNTALDYALQNDDKKMAAYLIKRGAKQKVPVVPEVEAVAVAGEIAGVSADAVAAPAAGAAAEQAGQEASFVESGTPAAGQPVFWDNIKDLDGYISGLEKQLGDARQARRERSAKQAAAKK